MSTELGALAWKEWNERKLALAAGTTWMLGGVLYLVAYEAANRCRASVASFYGTCTVYGLFAAVFLAMRTALGEVTQQTLGFSSALPLSRSRIGAVRLAGAIVTLAAPMLLAAVVLSLVLATGWLEQAPPRGSGNSYVDLTLRESLSRLGACGLLWKTIAIEVAAAVELLLILVALGARRRSEAQIGFLGAIIGFILLILSGEGFSLAEAGHPQAAAVCGAFFPTALAVNFGYSTVEGTSYGDLALGPAVWGPLGFSLLLFQVLAVICVRRYGFSPGAAGERPSIWRRWGLPALLSRLPLRFPGPWAALAWADLRQSLPLAAAGLALTVLLTVENRLSESSMQIRSAATLVADTVGSLPDNVWFVAILWATVVAAGIFSAELQPGLGQFWRSRPIRPATWFWVKYLAGLVAVVGTLDGVVILASWNSPFGHYGMDGAYVACLPLLHAFMYSLAVLGVCWLRRAVLGAMAALVFEFFVFLTLSSFSALQPFEPIEVYNRLYFSANPRFGIERGSGVLDLTGHHYPLVYGTIAIVCLLAALLSVPAVLRAGAGRRSD